MIRCKLSGLLGERRMKLSELSKLTGLAYTGLHRVYHEKTSRVDHRTINQICLVLDCQPGDLLEYVPDEKPKKRGRK